MNKELSPLGCLHGSHRMALMLRCVQEEATSSRGEAAEELRTQVERLEEELLDASQRLMAADAARQAERFALSLQPFRICHTPGTHPAAPACFCSAFLSDAAAPPSQDSQ